MDGLLRKLETSQLWSKATIRSKNGSVLNEKFRRQEVIQRSIADGELLIFIEAAELALKPYVSSLYGLVEESQIVDLAQYQRTSVGGYFQWHSDGTAEGPRRAVAIVYIADASNGLVGGATEFEIDGKITRIDPKSGMALLFSPELRHRGAEVFAGTKFALALTFSDRLRYIPPSIA